MHQSKILIGTKQEKRGGKKIPTELTVEQKYEDMQKRYENILEEYKEAKLDTITLNQSLGEKQERYILREKEYRDVIKQLENKKIEQATCIMEPNENIGQDEWLKKGIDTQDPEQYKPYRVKQEKLKINDDMLKNKTNYYSKCIKDIANEMNPDNGRMVELVNEARENMGRYLQE